MQELDQYLKWCDSMYGNSNPCNCGNACTNNNYCKGQQINCYECIKRVHSYRNSAVHYNCSKMVWYYVLKHCYRFGAEIFYEFYWIRKDLGNWNDIFVASIGCGPCTELFGAISQWRTLGKQDACFHFRGFDIEPLWTPVMQQACSYFNTADVTTYFQDIFSYYLTNQERVDVIVLNYMLSDMRKFHVAQFNGFLTNLEVFIRQKRPRYILINDIYLLVSLCASKDLLRFIKNAGLSFRYAALQFHYFHPFIGQYGKQIDKQPFAMTDATIVRKYNPFSEVNSIQTIIKFQ